MRTTLVAGLALALVACGGGEKKAESAATPAPGATPAPAAVTAVAGATHDVNMVLDGSTYHFVPNHFTIKVGDKVVFHNVSGGPHNVQFWADSIPAGAADPLKAAMPDQMSDLVGNLITEANGTYAITFANVPTGDYGFTCLPHMAMGMNGKVTVTK